MFGSPGSVGSRGETAQILIVLITVLAWGTVVAVTLDAASTFKIFTANVANSCSVMSADGTNERYLVKSSVPRRFSISALSIDIVREFDFNRRL